MSSSEDRNLGMDRPITRRDFLNGVAIGIGGLIGSSWLGGFDPVDLVAAQSAQDSAGFRGSHSFWTVARSGILMPAATWSWVCEFARSHHTAKLPPRICPSYCVGTGVVPRTTSGVHCS